MLLKARIACTSLRSCFLRPPRSPPMCSSSSARLVRGLLTRLISLLTLALCFWSTQASAQGSAAAEALFRSAQKAAEQGDWVTACDRFEESNRLDPAPGTVLNIARCRERLEQWASAWENYRKAGELLPAGDRRGRYAQSKAEELASRVPRLTLLPPEVPDEVSDYTVLVEETEYAQASLGLPLPFDPGTLRILVQAPGRETFEVVVTLEEGAEVEQRLELGAIVTSDGPPVALEDAAPSQRTKSPHSAMPAIVAYTVGGLGAAAAAGGGIWAAVELPKVADNCNDGRCNQVGADASARGRSAMVVTGIGAGVAVVGATVGTIFWLRASSAEGIRRGATAGPSWQWGVAPHAGGAALNLRASLRGGKLWF